MANLVMGAMGNLVPKLYELLKDEYKLQTGVKQRIRSLTKELEVAQAALCKVAEVPWDQLDKQVQLWAREVREASYDMEDVLDTFLVRVKGPDSVEQEKHLLKLLKKISNLFKKSKARRKISIDVKDILSHLEEVTVRCRRYKVDDIVARPATVSTVDPRLHAMYTQVNKLVGIEESSSELKSKLKLDEMSVTKIKTVSIVGIGGLGKTTLAKAVFDSLRGDFNCGAFVSVGRNPDLQRVLQMILIALNKGRYEKFNFAVLQDITQFIDELRDFLHQNKRYFIVIDDLWEKRSWETLKLAIPDGKSCEGRIIVTTRKWDVAKNADEVYELPPLPYDSSRKLFYARIYGDEIKYIDYQQPDEVSEKILRKCVGIPLAIITMASLLVDEPRDRWFEVYKSVGFGCKENEEAENNMKKILSFSYYDLPSHLRTCLLYLSAFQEDSVICKVSLIWMWAAEGFIHKQQGKGLLEIGEGYFNDLVNRSLIQEVEPKHNTISIHGCRVHDMVLDFIRSMSDEENFFTVLDNIDQSTLVRRNVLRRLAHHNKVMLHSNLGNMFDMLKVRSFIALEWVFDTWAPLSSFKLLRVLNIGSYGNMRMIGDSVGVDLEPVGHLLHLRFLGIHVRWVKKIPEEIASLKMLQTLDLSSAILELPSSRSLPTQLVCLHIWFEQAELFSVGRLTCLEQLRIGFKCECKASRLLVKELGSLRELRVLNADIFLDDEESQRDLVESVHHLDKLQVLEIYNHSIPFPDEMEFVLPGDIRRLILFQIVLWKLPSCIDPLCHRKLCHLDLCLECMDEQELKTLGRLPELRFLALDVLGSSPTIHNISDNDACYFPKLRCLKLFSMVMLVANKGDCNKSFSFHIWDGKVDDSIIMPSVSDPELQSGNEFSSVSQLLCVSDEEKKEGSISTREGEGHGAAAPQFMPRLQVLDFLVREDAVRDPLYCNNLGLEFLSSLQEIFVRIHTFRSDVTSAQVEEVKAALRRAAHVHPNHPTLHLD